MAIKHFSISINGLVQGVSFRWAATRIANNLDIRGFILNKPDGSVYIEAEGEENDLQEFIEWCKVGPERAIIDNCTVKENKLNNYTSFEVRY